MKEETIRNMATTLLQSRKLLELGISPNTADMTYVGGWNDSPCCIPYAQNPNKDDTPAWSLAAIMGLLPKKIDVDEQDFDCELMMQYNLETERMEIGYCSSGIHGESTDILTACINLIEQLVKQGYINTKKQEQ